MENKELESLKEKVYSISNSLFPLDTFLNDIAQHKEQDYNKDNAYNNMNKIVDVALDLKSKNEKFETIFKYFKQAMGLVYDEQENAYFLCILGSGGITEYEITKDLYNLLTPYLENVNSETVNKIMNN